MGAAVRAQRCGRLIVCAAVMAALLLQSRSAPASPPIRIVRLPGGEPGVELIVQGSPVLRLRGATAETRAAQIARRLVDVLVRPGPPFTATLVRRAEATDLLLNGRHILTVDATQATANSTTPDALAQLWGARLVAALGRNTVALTPALLVLRPGQTSQVMVEAFIPGPVGLGPYDERVATARILGGTILIEARGVGHTQVPIIVGAGQAALQIIVRRDAGVIPEQATVFVAGEPTPAIVREAVERRIDQLVMREPGTSLSVGPVLLPEPVPADEAWTLTVPVRLRSPYALPVERDVIVTVTRQTVDLIEPHTLLVSNRPEAVRANGVLFSDVIGARQATRLLYHHQNGIPHHNLVLSVVLRNERALPARVLLISGLAGPSPDPLFVGYAATSRFLQNLTTGRGYVLELPGESTYAFTVQTVAPRQLVSGILQFQLLAGEDLEVKVQIRSPWLLDRTVTSAVNQLAYPHPRGTFRRPFVSLARTVDLTWNGILGDIGTAAGLQDVKTGETLIGDYGVVYTFTVTAHNPRRQDVTADLIAFAAGGLTRGILLIDGEVVDPGMVRPNEERVIATITVAAGMSRTLRIVTMPAAGSYYPVRLLLRPRE